MGEARRAIFLDRDGVINRNVLNLDTGEYEAPLSPAELHVLPGVLDALQQLQTAGFLLFLVSNQPNYAKRKSSLADLYAIHAKLQRELHNGGIAFAASYYCLHHAQGTRPGYSGPCACRKPSPYFLLRAIREFSLDPSQSWMIGDRPTDVLCGHAAGVRTILVASETPRLADAMPNHVAPNLSSAAELICGSSQTNHLDCRPNTSELAEILTALP
jgi:D-glycero-D-manno-heptose 1,7-bisphosphate phosphatase